MQAAVKPWPLQRRVFSGGVEPTWNLAGSIFLMNTAFFQGFGSVGKMLV